MADKDKVDKNKDNKNKELENEDDSKEKKPLTIKKVVIIMSSAFALIMLITVISLILILKKNSSNTSTSTSATEQTVEKKQIEDSKTNNQLETTKEDPKDNNTLSAAGKKKTAIFYSIKPVFIVNLNSAKVKFLQISIDVMTRNNESINRLVNNLPLVKNELLILFSNKNYEDIKSLEGREMLRREALKVIKSVLEKETGEDSGIEDVLFTGFVVQ